MANEAAVAMLKGQVHDIFNAGKAPVLTADVASDGAGRAIWRVLLNAGGDVIVYARGICIGDDCMRDGLRVAQDTIALHHRLGGH